MSKILFVLFHNQWAPAAAMLCVVSWLFYFLDVDLYSIIAINFICGLFLILLTLHAWLMISRGKFWAASIHKIKDSEYRGMSKYVISYVYNEKEYSFVTSYDENHVPENPVVTVLLNPKKPKAAIVYKITSIDQTA